MINSCIKIIVLLFCILSYSCVNSYEKNGVYFKNHTRIEITDKKIEIEKNAGNVYNKCIGTYISYSRNKIKINCNDFRGDSVNKGSVVNIFPYEFNVNDEIIKIKKNSIIYQGVVFIKTN